MQRQENTVAGRANLLYHAQNIGRKYWNIIRVAICPLKYRIIPYLKVKWCILYQINKDAICPILYKCQNIVESTNKYFALFIILIAIIMKSISYEVLEIVLSDALLFQIAISSTYEIADPLYYRMGAGRCNSSPICSHLKISKLI